MHYQPTTIGSIGFLHVWFSILGILRELLRYGCRIRNTMTAFGTYVLDSYNDVSWRNRGINWL